MKVVVEMDERDYNTMKKGLLIVGVKDGKPLDNVLNDIKAEITDKSYLSYDDNPRHIIDESWVLDIIDKYKAESEEKG